MDDLDRASEYEELFRESALRQRKEEPRYEGRCLNCGEQSKGAYCDQECRDDAERIYNARIRNGKAKEEISDSEV